MTKEDREELGKLSPLLEALVWLADEPKEDEASPLTFDYGYFHCDEELAPGGL